MAYKKPVWKTVENPVEQNEFYIVKKNDDGSYTIYTKQDDIMFRCVDYKIVNSTLLYDTKHTKLLSNHFKYQPYGLGRSLTYSMIIDSWEEKNGEVIVRYTDENNYKFVRHIDEQGNLYKKKKAVSKIEKEEELSL